MPDCDNTGQTRRGYCEPHYRKFRRWGDPLGSAPEPVTTCSVPSCPTVGQTRRGMCQVHYRRSTLTGYPALAAPVRIVGDDDTRFWSYVDKNGPLPAKAEWLGICWLWTGYVNPDGYGKIRVGGRVIGAHQMAFELIIGAVPQGLELDHLCRNTVCVRPDHLEPVTAGENVRRRNYARAGKPWLSQQKLSAFSSS